MNEPTFRERAFSRARMLDTERSGTHLPPLVRVVQTCEACPSQWDAWDATGQYYISLMMFLELAGMSLAENASVR